MMDRLWSMPPHTFGLVSPVCCATLTNCTGDVVVLDTAASTKDGSLHSHRGVVRASVSVLPSMKREEPRKRRRGKIIDCDDTLQSSDVCCGHSLQRFQCLLSDCILGLEM